jgi:protein SFI1
LHKIFHHWHFAFKQHKARRQVLENKLEQNRLATLAGAFEQWRYRIREIELAPMAEDLRQRFDDGLAYAALSTWKRTSKRLPAIAFFGKSLKKEAWRKWREALPEARRLRHAAKAGDERMMSE